MPNPSLTLWVDSSSSRLLSGWQSVSSATAPIIKQGDKIGVEVHWVSNYNGGTMSEVSFPSAVAMTLAVGRIDAAPTGGSFKFSYASQTTSALAFNSTALEVQTALNALTSITSEGGVAVTKISTTYRIVWNTAGVPASTLTVGSNELYPSSTIGINNVKTGTVSVRQIYQAHIKQAPVANITSFVSQTASTMSVSTIHTQQFSGDSSVWRISIAPEPRDGSFLLTFSRGSTNYVTSPIAIEATSLQIADALGLASTGYNGVWSCIKTGKYSWDISTSDSAVFNFGFNDGGIISFNSKYGVLDMNTAEVEDLLAGNTSAAAFLEIEIESDGTRQTILQTPCTVQNDLIDSDSYTTVNWGDVLPADSVVRYDTSQILTTGQKTQARTNIGAIDSSNIAALEASDLLIQGRLTTLEGKGLTDDQYAAINEATTLSATDPVLAESQIATLLSGKANDIHTHVIGDVQDLALELNSKADIAHTHVLNDITDFDAGAFVTPTQLTNGLATKADAAHTHTTLNSVYVSDLSVPQVTFTDATVQTTAGIPEAPNDGFYYLRYNGFWVQCQVTVISGHNTITLV